MKLILLSLGVMLQSAMGSSEFLEMKCLGKNKLDLEIFIHHNIQSNSATYSIRNKETELVRASGEFSEVVHGKTNLGFYSVSYLSSTDPEHTEGIGIGLPNIENLNELNFGKAEGNGEGIMSLADDTQEYISTQICEIRKTQTHCLEYEDAIHMRFCEEVLPEVQSTTCEDTAKEALTQHLEYYSRIREHQEPSFEILSATTRSISYHQLQNEGFVEVSYRSVDPNGLEVKYGTQYAQVLVKRISEKNCSAVDILIH